MSIDLSGAKIDLLDKDYPQKHNDAMDLIEAEINGFEADVSSQVAAFEEEVGTEVAEFEAAVNASVFALQAQFDELESDIEQVQLIARDPTAWVSAILKSRGITNIKAIAFKTAEGWEKQGNQSYKTETRPTGRFLGDYANATAAWAANYQDVATVAGDYYWQTSGTVGQFECTTSNASTQIYRGSTAEMPAEAVFIATTTRVLIFDLSNPLVPMWMEFVRGGSSSAKTFLQYAIPSALAYKNGILALGTDQSVNAGVIVQDYVRALNIANFKDDSAVPYKYRNGYNTAYSGRKVMGLANRNSSAFYANSPTDALGSTLLNSSSGGHNIRHLAFSESGKLLVSTGVCLAVLDADALSAILSSSTNNFRCAAELNGRLYAINDTASPEQLIDFGFVAGLGASFAAVNTWTNATTPSMSAATLATLGRGKASLLIQSASAVDQLWPNTAVMADSLIARRGTSFATPPMKKPEVMLICGTATGAVTGSSDYVADFSATADGFTNQSNSIISWDPTGKLVVDRNAGMGSAAGIARSRNVLQVGRVYFLTLIVSSSPGSMRIQLSGVSTIEEPDVGYYSGSGTHCFLFRATQQYFEIYLSNTYGEVKFSAITAEEVIRNLAGTALAKTAADINWHGVINGSLTATAEITGGVAMLSGFTVNANYIEGPNPWAGVGASDAWICGAFKCAASTVDERILGIGYWDGVSNYNAAIVVSITAGGLGSVYVTNDAGATSVQALTAGIYDDGLLHTFVVKKTSTHYRLEIDDIEVASIAVGSHGNLTFHASAKMFVGRNASGTGVGAAISAAMIGAGIATLSSAESALIHRHLRNLVNSKAALDEVPTALAYNSQLEAVEMVGTTYRQTMQAGAIVASVAHGVGSTPAVAVGSRSEIGIGGATGVSVSVPGRNLREYNARLTTERFTVTYAGNATRTLFPDPANGTEMAVTMTAKPVRVADAGVVQTEGAAESYTVADYGLGRNVVKFAVAPGNGNDVIVEFEREVWK